MTRRSEPVFGAEKPDALTHFVCQSKKCVIPGASMQRAFRRR